MVSCVIHKICIRSWAVFWLQEESREKRLDFLELPLQAVFKRLKGNSTKDVARDGNWKENKGI